MMGTTKPTTSRQLSVSTLRAVVECETRWPYLAAALDRLPLVETDECPSVGCSRHGVLYVSPEYLGRLTPEAAGGALASAVWSWLSEHWLRQGGREAELWHAAAAMEVHDDLTLLPPGAHRPSELELSDGQAAESYVRELDRTPGVLDTLSKWYNVEPHSPDTFVPYGSASGSGVSRNQGLLDQGPALPESDGRAAGQDRSAEGQGSGSGRSPAPEAFPWETHVPELTAEDAQAIRATVAQELKNSGGAGNQPGLMEWATERLKVRLPPLSVRLRQAAISAGGVLLQRQETFRRPSRRQVPGGILFPGRERRRCAVAIILDTSGSMLGMGDWLLGLVYATAQKFGQPVWIMGDVTIQKTGSRPPKQLVGGGGTDLANLLRQVDELGFSLIFLATDGDTFCGWPTPEELETPVVVLLTEGGTPPPRHLPHVVIPRPEKE